MRSFLRWVHFPRRSCPRSGSQLHADLQRTKLKIHINSSISANNVKPPILSGKSFCNTWPAGWHWRTSCATGSASASVKCSCDYGLLISCSQQQQTFSPKQNRISAELRLNDCLKTALAEPVAHTVPSFHRTFPPVPPRRSKQADGVTLADLVCHWLCQCLGDMFGRVRLVDFLFPTAADVVSEPEHDPSRASSQRLSRNRTGRASGTQNPFVSQTPFRQCHPAANTCRT